jgi:predicted transcriptional regulator of viral defense system
MPKLPVLMGIKQLRRPVFTTAELAASCGGTLSNTTQALNHFSREGVVFKIARGIWGIEMSGEKVSPYSLIPFLLPRHRAYLSFISALHLHGIIEQIPQVITVASTSHTRTIKTKLGTFIIHRIAPEFFKGFDWYKGDGDFLIAEPEKAFVDCLYISVRKKKQFGYFPELHFSRPFSFYKAKRWAKDIRDLKIRAAVLKKIETFVL